MFSLYTVCDCACGARWLDLALAMYGVPLAFSQIGAFINCVSVY